MITFFCYFMIHPSYGVSYQEIMAKVKPSDMLHSLKAFRKIKKSHKNFQHAHNGNFTEVIGTLACVLIYVC